MSAVARILTTLHFRHLLSHPLGVDELRTTTVDEVGVHTKALPLAHTKSPPLLWHGCLFLQVGCRCLNGAGHGRPHIGYRGPDDRASPETAWQPLHLCIGCERIVARGLPSVHVTVHSALDLSHCRHRSKLVHQI